VCVFFLITPIFFYIYGSLHESKFYKSEIITYDYKVRAISSNISLDRFYTNIDPVSVINDLIKISEPNKNEKIIFVWPEGILPSISQEELIEYNWLFNKNFNENHIFIIGINSYSINDGSREYFNTFSVYDSKLNLLDSYSKINLVPFGEFLPLENILRGLGLKSITNNYQSFSSGLERNIIEIKQQNFSIKILPLVCYEIIYSGKIFNNSDFDFIINISEDGWFGQSIGPKQHFIHSIFRAIESGKYILRSANNGMAAIINPIGIVEDKVDFGQSGYIDFNENRKIQPTVFSKYGNKIFGLLILLYILLIFSFNKFKNE
jgi:apolipoprotein N-acyltransferase